VKEGLFCLVFCAEVNSSHCLWLSELAGALAVFLTIQCPVIMYRRLNTQQFYVLPTQCIYVFCMDLRTNSDYFPIQH
jgi:hypothetical protein